MAVKIGYVDTIEETAERVLWLLRNPEEGVRLAEKGRALVCRYFLNTRLIADELRLYASLLASAPRAERLYPNSTNNGDKV